MCQEPKTTLSLTKKRETFPDTCFRSRQFQGESLDLLNAIWLAEVS